MFEENDLVSLGFRNIVLRVPVLPPDLDGGDPVAPPAGVEIVDPGDPGPVPPVLDAGFAKVDMGADVGLGVGPYLQELIPSFQFPVESQNGSCRRSGRSSPSDTSCVPLAACILEKDNFVLQGSFPRCGLFISRPVPPDPPMARPGSIPLYLRFLPVPGDPPEEPPLSPRESIPWHAPSEEILSSHPVP